MQIVHLGKFYPPEWGGIESVTEALADEHTAAGHKVDVVCFTRGISETSGSSPTVRRFRIFSAPSSQPISFGYFINALKIGRNADVLHVHAPNILAALVSIFMPKYIKVVVQWHADIVDKGLIGHLVRPLERAMLKRADEVVCTTPVYAAESIALQPFLHKISTVPLGIHETPPSVCPNSLGDYVLFVGRLVPYKGLSVLLDAIPHVDKSVRFVLVGEGPEEQPLREQATRLGINDKVMFMGKTEVGYLNALYAHAQLFCLPSVNRLEAFGVVLLEAMRANLPLVTTNIPGSGVAWVNQDGVTGRVVPPNDPKALAHAIEEVLETNATKQRYAKGAHARFLATFTRKAMADQFLAIYEKPSLAVSSDG